MKRYHVEGNYEMEGHDCTVSEDPDGDFVSFTDARNAYLAAWSAEWRCQEALKLVDEAVDLLDEALPPYKGPSPWEKRLDAFMRDAMRMLEEA